jgi:hypothetical protein
VPPERELGPAQIDDLGGYDIADVLGRATSALGLDGASVVVIVNGRRVTSPQGVMGFPPDALARLEVLPREAGALYGGDPSSRVVNLVLQRRFDSRDGLLNAARATAGGRSSVLADARRSTIANNDTTQFGVRVSRDTSLRAGERRLDEGDVAGPLSVTLRPASDTVAANLAVNRALGAGTASLSANARRQEDRSVYAVDGEGVRTTRTVQVLSLNGGLGGELRGWNVQLGLAGTLNDGDQRGAANARSRTRTLAATLGADGRVLDLPAGPATASLSGRLSRTRSAASGDLGARASGVDRIADLSGNLALPLSRRTGGGGLGDTVLTLGASVQDAGEAGGGHGLNGALSWSPRPKVSVNGSWSKTSSSPTSAQRFDPVYYGPPRVVFDFRTGQAVEVRPILGGDPALRSQASHQVSVTASAGPFTRLRIAASTTFQAADAIDGIGALPTPTPAVEAAFPERFVRDAEGRLLSIDLRPVNLQRARTRTLMSNLTFALPVGGGLPGGPSAQVALNHTWRMRNVLTLRDGLAAMDRLAGDGGGSPRHEFGVQLDGRLGAWGLNAGARWREGYRVRREIGRDGADDLMLSGYGAVDVKLSYLLARAAPASGQGAGQGGARRVAGLRAGLEIENLLDARPAARQGDGRPAPGYGRNAQDPVGRIVRVTLSRRF